MLGAREVDLVSAGCSARQCAFAHAKKIRMILIVILTAIYEAPLHIQSDIGKARSREAFGYRRVEDEVNLPAPHPSICSYEMKSPPGWVTVLVLGGCGNLGRHMVKLLMEQGKGIKEIRVLDCQEKPPDCHLVSNGTKLSFIKGDIRNMDDLRSAFQDVTVVVHSAALVQSGAVFINDVNIKGTENVIKACLECNVQNLVYTSSTEISRDTSKSVENCDEDDIDKRALHHVGDHLNGYTKSKQIAENKVRAAEGQLLNNGKRLHTVVLRPCGIYGDGDKVIIPKFLKFAHKCSGFLPRMGGTSTRVSLVYVGNAAWAHVCAVQAILSDAEKVTGRCYNITDDTPVTDYFTFVEPFLEAHYMKVLPISIPILMVYYVMFLLEIFCVLISPIFKVSLPSTKEEALLAGTTSHYSGKRCRRELNYTPYYSYKEAYSLAYKYYAFLVPKDL